MSSGAARRFAPGRILIAALILLYCGLVVGSGMDRLSASNASLRASVPGPFRAQADHSEAQAALLELDSAAALSSAQAAIASDPVDRNSAGLLGAARYLEGEEVGARQAFAVSAQMGWRNLATQLYWHQQALLAGDVEEAALRVDAILRQDPYLELGPDLIVPLEGTPDGRAALAGRLALRPNWLQRYSRPRSTIEDIPLEGRVAVLSSISDQGVELGCEVPAGIVRLLLARGQRASAQELWQAHCPEQTVSAGLADGGFEQLSAPGNASPFGWRSYRSGTLALAFVDDGKGGKALSASNRSSSSKLVLSQAVELGQGSYVIKARPIGGQSSEQSRLAASLDCAASPSLPQDVDGTLLREGQRLAVYECKTLVLSLWLRPGDSRIVFDDIEIAPED
jgi:hypothetical protein